LLTTSAMDPAAAAGLMAPGAVTPAAPLAGDAVADAVPLQPAMVPLMPLPPREKGPRPGSFQAEAMLESSLPGSFTHTNPYSDIPSIYDIYAHTSGGSGAVVRFGQEIFDNPADVSRTIPIDFPASPDYVVGPGDGLTINLWGSVTQRLSSTVDHEGRINLPETGPVLVSGKSLSETQRLVQRTLQTQFRDVSADVSLSRLRTIRVYVVGDVNGPGAYDVSSLSTPLNVLLAAGGPTSLGSLRVVQHYRGNTLVQEVDLYDLLLHGNRSGLQRLESGDTLLVPAVGTQVRIDGMVRRPALYELHGETNLAQVLGLAGGILPTAALNRIEIQRLEAHEKRTMVSLDLSGAGTPEEIENKLEGFTVRDRDEIHIFPIATFNQDAVYLRGHVLRQGRYSYKPGMRVTDVISSYADLLPEPSTKYAEIIHLTLPDFRPKVESFDLGAALANPATAPKLQPLDTVRIYSRYDFEDAPIVSVSGAVRHPGTFPTSGQIHFRDAIQLAGGLTPDASTEAAQIIRPMPDSSLEVMNIRLKEALNGNPIENVLLEPRDRILIQENVLADDPKTVVINGEVTNPGRYPLTAKLRVTDLIQLAGGFKRSAETSTADLTQFITSKSAPIVAKHENIDLASAMAGNGAADLNLGDGDVLTIRQRPGWDDVGASVTIEGEVAHPGTYGLRAGERLSSVIERAGGFQPEAYPFGAVLKRPSVRDHELQARDELMSRVRNAQNNLVQLQDTDPKQKVAKELAFQQWQANLEQLNSNPPVGRIAIRISGKTERWKDTADDIQLEAGDVLVIPKKPGYVMVAGEVFNPTAITLRPGKNAKWYLTQAGGMTSMANKGAIFVVRADGSVLGGKNGILMGRPLSKTLQAGDTVVVPEKALSGNVPWQGILLAAQVAASITSTAFIAARY
jgi:protein involved in polysaccharide export with SLBB domain